MPPKMHSTAAFFSRLNFSINKIRRTFWDLNSPFKYQEHHTPCWGQGGGAEEDKDGKEKGGEG